MRFGLFDFWIPLIAVIQIYHILPSRKWRNLCLLITSYCFYVSVDWRFLPLLLISTLTDYIAGFLVVPSRDKILRSISLSLSLSINLSLLITFKYIPDIFQVGDGFVSLLTSIGLPLGISFYTFQTISYTIDCYRGNIKPSSDFISFALYVSFFPQLAAGPIEKARNLLPQFQNAIEIKIQHIKEAFYLILLGLFKKIYVAGALIHPLRRIYEADEAPPSLVFLSGLLATCHVYADFSSYSDLARGIARFFGIKLMVNFKPFIFARNPKEYWSNWHISLYQWILDYLVRPVIKVLKVKKLSYIILIVFITIALWHKISLTSLLFGGFNAGSFLAYRFYSKTRFWLSFPRLLKYSVVVTMMLFFHTINGWLYYFNDEAFLKLPSKIMQFRGFGRETFDVFFYLTPFLLPLFIYEWFQNKYGTELFILKSPFLVRAFWIAFVIACVFVFERNTEHDFVYFGF